ncbi:cellulose synthase subunit BcsC-related outer membrane protein [Granulicella sibirica]|uniref:Cellulose synthase operon protein C n=1 Tax=Granulicella sibirica TaxID=2479048 RepID=A0A4Q0T440_9BACT|nr:cellulose synthase subunit BcsC-related outer membrane protein [Granulicella sibirica]RXH56749.1 Cellulose synthase operon protein C [Granulicella sibirica]
MKSLYKNRIWAPALFMGAITFACPSVKLFAQVPPSATQSLLEKAHALEARGRMDMASQTWQQVLLADPNNVDALSGLARASKLSGDNARANLYLDRLRAINPNDPGIARIAGMGTEQSQTAQLRQAGKLAQSGQYSQAMGIYRQVFGGTPPAGDWAMAYYETESATEDGRPHAVAGLRSLVDKYPSDARYQIALGRILTYDPKTRAEGRRYLERYSKDPQAADALRQSLVWDSQNPASAADIRAYLQQHPEDTQLTQALKNQPPPSRRGPPQSPEARARSAEEQAAYRALNAHHLPEAEKRFRAILTRQPNNGPSLAGMGYIRMQQGNFGGAISYLVQAKEEGASDPGVETALATARFWSTMAEGSTALNENDLANAQKQYQAALVMRPESPEALEGLGGTLLKAQEPEAALPVFEHYIKVKNTAPAAWSGLFLAQSAEGNTQGALITESQLPPAVRAQLMRDPDYLRTLASVYSASGRDAGAQRVLSVALDLPFPSGGQGLKSETQLQYASLLQQANHLDQSAGLYRQVLAADNDNTAAWQGLVRVEHAMAHDPQALQTLESMPPAVYAVAMRDPGFETTVAAIYQGQGKLDIAQDLLEKAMAQQSTSGQKISIPVQLQLAGIYLQKNQPLLAYPIYQRVLTENPDRLDAWKGLLSSLHANGHDKEALAEVQQIPAPVRAQLENDPEYLQTIGGVYGALGQNKQAGVFLARVQRIYSARHSQPPADIDIQNGWLLYNSGNDAGLYRQLMNIGSRADLTEEQRRTVQTQWTSWAVRRANQAAAAGDSRRSLAILNATARAFPDNPGVIKALASGYARAGQPKLAVAIFKAQDMTQTTASDYKAAVGAALAAGDTKDAETWLRYGLDAYPRDSQMLALGAKFEQARGDNTRAADYYRASLAAMPPPDPGAELADELSRPVPSSDIRLPNQSRSQDLATLLAPGSADNAAAAPAPPPQSSYLPSYTGAYGSAPVQLNSNTYSYPVTQPSIPSYNPNQPPTNPKSPTRLKDYVPQSSNTRPTTLDDFVLPSTPPRTNASIYTAPEATPTVQQSTPRTYQQEQISRATERAASQPLPITSSPSETVYGAYVPYVAPTGHATAVPVDLGERRASVPLPQPEVTDVTPTAKYMPNAHTNGPSTRPELAAARAAAIRRAQSNPTGQSNPPEDEFNAPTKNAQFTQPYNAAQAQADQVSRPAAPPAANVPAPPDQTFDPNDAGQQYPQPRRTVKAKPKSRPAAPAPAQQAATPPPVSLPPVSYPPVPQPLDLQPVPSLGQPNYIPSDADLVARNVPPLRGSYDQVPREPNRPLTEREQTERDLATLEASYSGWLGGTGYARYRSGTPGIDRLTDLEAPVEASAVIAHNVRVTVIPRPVFLNSGTLDVASFQGLTGTVPIIGTLPANALTAPAQQSSNGIGGEGQIVTTNFGAALGYTPYEFLVRNITGRARYRPNGGHFTFLFDRDSVKETQLSYAGLRDPGSASPVYAGNIWGGVVSTSGTVRFDMGDEKSGFYLSGGGGTLNGYHVLDNTTFNGTAGAYFRVKVFPEYGSLNIGGSFYGSHFAHNERGLTYGSGGYFSPNAYFLASIPVTFTGHYKTDFHYVVSGGIGVQTFQEDSAPYYALDPALQTGALSGCTLAGITARTCGYYPVNSNTGANYAINAQGSYRVAEHWYVGGFISGNNTNNYNTINGGFFIRYLFRPQYSSEDYPTGLFPLDGFRPLRVP